MNQYIITEGELQALAQGTGTGLDILIIQQIRSHPYNPQAEREKVLDELISWMKGRYDLPALKEKIERLREGKDGE